MPSVEWLEKMKSDVFERIRKEVVVRNFKLLYKHDTGRIKAKNKKNLSD